MSKAEPNSTGQKQVNAKAQTGVKTAKKQPEQESEAKVELTLPETVEPKEVQRTLAKHHPGWHNLCAQDRAEMIELSIWCRKNGNPVRVEIGETSARAVGMDRVLATLKLHKCLGSMSNDFVNAKLTEIRNYLDSVGANNDSRLNAVLAYLEAMQPRDPAEVNLLIQAYITNDAAARALGMIGSANWVEHVSAYGNLANKLMNTHVRQLEALAKLRRGGEQVVRHVHVNQGGQAVFAETINNAKRGVNEDLAVQPYEQGARSAAMLGQDTQGNGVPIACDERKETLSASRGSAGIRSTDRK